MEHIASCFFLFLCYSIKLIYFFILIIIYLNKKIILINKFNKHNQINNLYFYPSFHCNWGVLFRILRWYKLKPL